MFLFIPYRSDAATGAVPWGTIGLILANCAVVVLWGFPDPDVAPPNAPTAWLDSWVLRFGHFNPLTWLSSAFIHFGWFHLIWNMVFLWTFGFVVESLLGWRRLLLVYSLLAMIPSSCVQVAMLGADEGGAGGASGAIMGLLAIAALWSPRNRLSVFVWIFILIRRLEARVITFCALWIGIEVFKVLLQGFRMSSELLHVAGAGAGVGVSLVMLKQGWVQTDGWDYLSLRRHGQPRVRWGAAPEPTVQADPDPRVGALVAVRDALEVGDASRAEAAYRSGQNASPGWVLHTEELGALIKALFAAGDAEAGLARMEEFVLAYAKDVPAPRLQLAEQLIRCHRPGRALQHLASLDDGQLTDAQRETRRKLDQQARAGQQSGGLELE